ncbi:MAG: Putative transmembrane protein [uncultured Paraburkholderia sp.]|nr:MAG: Putative transmembrane protein [uncultured Paraburkholderia sp.]CAH2926216.1 MAG: Putative transmembrane protein [uncultured Paraburkholderia sp.]
MSYKRGLAVVFGCAIAALVSFAATYPRFYPSPSAAGAPAANGNGAAPAPAPALGVELPGLPGSTSPLAWSRLSSAEHIALAPFEAQWDSFSDERKRKWLKIASRYSKLSPEGQKRLHDQMTEWIRMTPDQRRVARENYQVSKQLPRETRQNAWKAYQQLPEETKQRLAASEHKRRPSVVSAPPSGRSEIKGLDRLVNARERAAASGTPSASAGAAASLPSPASLPVSPAEAPSIFNGS